MQMEALSELTFTQITDMATTPGQLTSGGQVITVMRHIPDKQLGAFYDELSPAIMVSAVKYPVSYKSFSLITGKYIVTLCSDYTYRYGEEFFFF